MDHQQRSMARARAEWRAKRAGKTSGSLWGFENWATDGTEGHHVARKKYGDLLIDVPISAHRELTRRQMEEHPPDGPDPENPLERQGRVERVCLKTPAEFVDEVFYESAYAGWKSQQPQERFGRLAMPSMLWQEAPRS
jgi:hypothetical protein